MMRAIMTRPDTAPQKAREAEPRRGWRHAALSMAALCVFTFPALDASAQQQRTQGELPPNPNPNACYARVWIPGETREQSQRVVVQEEAEELLVEPAQYQWVEKDIEIEGAAERIELIPARFEKQRREIVIEPERREVKVLPPVFETVDQPVLVRPAYQAWRPCSGAVDSISNATATGEVMCFDTVPAEYKTIKARVLREPARLSTKIIPAKTRSITVNVMVERPRRRIIRIPAKTQRLRVMEQVRPMRTQRRTIPAQFDNIVQIVPASPGRVEWWPILCESNTRPGLVRDIQRALRRRGFDPGPVDGQLGPKTMAALLRFQRNNNLPEGGLLIDTLQSLGIDVRG